MTDTEREALCVRIDELCAENDKLRERLKASDDGRMRQADNLIDKYHKIARLQTDNAKLLWLVNDMRACFRIGAERDGVSKQWCYELFDSYTSKLRELGIEVAK